MPELRFARRIPTHLLVAASAWGSRVVIAICQLITIRILIGNLGTNQYAFYVLLAAIIPWFQLSDFGLGVSLQNFISERRATGDNYDSLVVTGTIAASSFGLIILFFFVSIAGVLAPLYLKDIGAVPAQLSHYLFVFTVVISTIAGVGGMAVRIWYGQQKGYLANVILAVSSIVGLILVWLCSFIQGDIRLQLSVFSQFIPQALFLAIALLTICRTSYNNGGRFEKALLKPILKRSSRFFFFGIMASLTLQVDYIIISQVLATKDIVEYNIASKIFGIVFFIYNAIILAIWPSCSESLASKDWKTVDAIVAKALMAGFAIVVSATLLLMAAMPEVVGLLSAREKIVVPVGFLGVFGLYFCLRVWTDTYAMILQSMSIIRPFIIIVPIQAALSIIGQFVFSRYYGKYGVLIGLIVSYLLTVAWLLPLSVKRIKTKHAES